MPEEDQAYLLAAFMLPDAASLQRTIEVAEEVEAIVAEIDAIESNTTIAGFSMLTSTMAPNAGFVFIQLTDCLWLIAVRLITGMEFESVRHGCRTQRST